MLVHKLPNLSLLPVQISQYFIMHNNPGPVQSRRDEIYTYVCMLQF